MLKKSSGDSAFGAAANLQASAAIASATDDLVMKKYLEDKKAKNGSVQEAKTVFINAKDENNGEQNDDDTCNTKTAGESRHEEVNDNDLDMDDDPVLRDLREKRIAALKKEFSAQQQQLSRGHGAYTIVTEQEFLQQVVSSELVIAHFFHRDFERCKIIDEHMRKMAVKHDGTLFIGIDAEKSPFVVGKLAIRTLPTLLVFNDGIAVDRIVGFTDMGGKDEFATVELAKRLVKAGGITSAKQRRSRKAKPMKTLQ